MDIYKQAKEMDADYMDVNTGYIYKIQDYNKAKKLGLPTAGIEVYDSEGNFIGIAKEA
jgi:hypothetical protein